MISWKKWAANRHGRNAVFFYHFPLQRKTALQVEAFPPVPEELHDALGAERSRVASLRSDGHYSRCDAFDALTLHLPVTAKQHRRSSDGYGPSIIHTIVTLELKARKWLSAEVC